MAPPTNSSLSVVPVLVLQVIINPRGGGGGHLDQTAADKRASFGMQAPLD